MSKFNLKLLFVFVFFAFLWKPIIAQPYFDAAGLTGWYIPSGKDDERPSEVHTMFFVGLPFTLNESDKLVITPWHENRYLKDENPNESLFLKGTGISITYLHTSPDSLWSYSGTFFGRMNSSDFRFDKDVFQAGGAIVGSLRLKPGLYVKLGLYGNNEFYGFSFIPLAGIDWKINDRLKLFGIVPNEVKLEYKLNKILYGGFHYRSLKTSYKDHGEAGYYKLEDNHIGIYADFTILKKMVFMAEAGHTFLRLLKNRAGTDFQGFDNDGFIFKAGIYYRVRFDN